jgi:hypothetical protein
MLFKTAPFSPFPFFLVNNALKWCCLVQNVPFHFKKNSAKNMQKSKSVLNLWFVQSSPQLQFWFQESIQLRPCQIQLPTLKLAAFFISILSLEFMQFNLQLINKLLISLIWPLI